MFTNNNVIIKRDYTPNTLLYTKLYLKMNRHLPNYYKTDTLNTNEGPKLFHKNLEYFIIYPQ